MMLTNGLPDLRSGKNKEEDMLEVAWRRNGSSDMKPSMCYRSEARRLEPKSAHREDASGRTAEVTTYVASPLLSTLRPLHSVNTRPQRQEKVHLPRCGRSIARRSPTSTTRKPRPRRTISTNGQWKCREPYGEKQRKKRRQIKEQLAR